AASLLALLLGYYLVFLEAYEPHRALRRTWSLAWTQTSASMLLAYGPAALLAAARLLQGRRRLRPDVALWVTCFAVSFLLSKHDWFTSPRQPLHFTRGYVWLPLWLLGLP